MIVLSGASKTCSSRHKDGSLQTEAWLKLNELAVKEIKKKKIKKRKYDPRWDKLKQLLTDK
jgi:uncharacterized metal-binding protein YceD (DUF177 family)